MYPAHADKSTGERERGRESEREREKERKKESGRTGIQAKLGQAYHPVTLSGTRRPRPHSLLPEPDRVDPSGQIRAYMLLGFRETKRKRPPKFPPKLYKFPPKITTESI